MRRHHQELVCERIQHGADRGLLSEAPCDDSVEHIGDARSDKNGESKAVPPIGQKDDEDRYEDNPQDGELVGRS